MSEEPFGIASVSIRDFRGIEKLDLDFCDPHGHPNRLVVLAGPNGCGKTAVLEGILLTLGYPKLVGLNPDSGHPNLYRTTSQVRHGKSDYRIEIKLEKGGEPQTFAGTSKSPFARGKGMFGPGKQLPSVSVEYFSSWRAPSRVGMVKISTAKPGNPADADEKNRLRRIKQFLVDSRAFDAFRSTSEAESKYRATLDRINAVWQSFYPGQSFDVEPLGDDPGAGFEWFLNSDGRQLPVDLLSSGQLELLMFAGELALSASEPRIVFIDEPELHLDPQWHAVLLRVLLKYRPNCQFIVGTHSPEVFDSVMSYQRHFLVPDSDPRARQWKPKLAEEGAA